ncbi:ABC transporter permease [Myxococcota bacterium]
MARFRIMRLLALRNLFSHKVSSAIVGGIISFGTLLVVLGTSVLDTIDDSMAQSITSSLAGHIQVYAADAQDDLALFGGGFMGGAEIGTIPDFKRVRSELEALANVEAVIPMGIQMHTDVPASDIDIAITRLRGKIAEGDEQQIEILEQQIRSMADDLKAELAQQRTISDDDEKAKIDERLAVIEKVQSDAFWEELGRDPEPGLTFLDTKLAPLSLEGEMLFMRNLGTDLERFADTFDRFELVTGEMVPSGHRGILFAERFYEDRVKNLAARELDEIHEAVMVRGRKIAVDPETKDKARRLPGQYRRIAFELSPEDAAVLEGKLRELLPEESGDLNALITAFLTVNDDNIDERHRSFYEHIAPRIRLYRVNVGDTITLRSYTKSGYMKALNIKLYGIYRFKSLEKSDLAGAQNLMDLVSFRELYGIMTREKLAELDSIREDVGARDVTRADAEAVLFGGEDDVEGSAKTVGFEDDDVLGGHALDVAIDDSTYDLAQVDDGLALNAAVILKDPTKIRETQAEIATLSEAKGLELQAVDWQTASGIVGQLIVVIRIVLYVAIFIIFLVALAIINNSMLMATLERTSEIGTMRALGARRSFVMMVFFLETLILGVVAGVVGALAGGAVVGLLGTSGIPAANDIMIFLFSGPRLFPEVGASNVVFALVVILLVSLASTLYPALMAARVQPVVAMQAKE